MSLIHALAEELAQEAGTHETLAEVPLRPQHLEDMLIEDVAELIDDLQAWGSTEVLATVQVGQYIGPVPQVAMPLGGHAGAKVATQEGGHDLRSASVWLTLVWGALAEYHRLEMVVEALERLRGGAA